MKSTIKDLFQTASTVVADKLMHEATLWGLTVSTYNSWELSIIASCNSKHCWHDSVEILRHLFTNQLANGLLPPSLYHAQPITDCTSQHYTQAPIQAYVIWQLYKNAPSKKAGKALVKEFFPKLLAQQRYFYAHRDTLGECLIATYEGIEQLGQYSPVQEQKKAAMAVAYSDPNACYNLDTLFDASVQRITPTVEDPVFNSIVCLANEFLIKMGKYLKEDVTEIVLWNELTIHSINDKLWNQDTQRFQTFDILHKQTKPLSLLDSLLTTAGLVPDQRAVEELLHPILALKNKKEQLKKQLDGILLNTSLNTEQPTSIPIDKLWLLHKGLERYHLKPIAKKLRKRLLATLTKTGFQLRYSLDKPIALQKTQQPTNDSSLLAASIAVDLLS